MSFPFLLVWLRGGGKPHAMLHLYCGCCGPRPPAAGPIGGPAGAADRPAGPGTPQSAESNRDPAAHTESRGIRAWAERPPPPVGHVGRCKDGSTAK